MNNEKLRQLFKEATLSRRNLPVVRSTQLVCHVPMKITHIFVRNSDEYGQKVVGVINDKRTWWLPKVFQDASKIFIVNLLFNLFFI